MEASPIKVMFVCLGNICRSPTAHGVFQKLVIDAGLSESIAVESSGTGAWHVGEPPDQRASHAARLRGYDLSALRARKVESQDFAGYHYMLAMDQQNLDDLQILCPQDYSGHLGLLLDFSSGSEREVPDPYYGAGDGFEQVLDLVEDASQRLLQHIQISHQL